MKLASLSLLLAASLAFGGGCSTESPTVRDGHVDQEALDSVPGADGGRDHMPSPDGGTDYVSPPDSGGDHAPLPVDLGLDAMPDGEVDEDQRVPPLDLGVRDTVSPPQISIVAHGAIADDAIDDTLAIFAAAMEAKCVGKDLLLPKGSYLFQITNDPRAVVGDHKQQTWVLKRDRVVSRRAFVSWKEMLGGDFDCANDEIAGVQHNFLERKVADLYQGPGVALAELPLGDFRRPPLAAGAANRTVDIVAHWWSRFGARYLPKQGPCHSYDVWATPWQAKCRDAADNGLSIYGPADYTWEWGHASGPRADQDEVDQAGNVVKVYRDPVLGITVDYPADYDPQRHPLLGFYRDDDPIVLDWIAYWLRSYGTSVVNIATAHWSKDFFDTNKVPNAATLKYMVWFPESLTEANKLAIANCFATPTANCPEDPLTILKAAWSAKLNQYYAAGMPFHSLAAASLRFPAVYVFRLENLRQALGSEPYTCADPASSPFGNGVCWRDCTDESCGAAQLASLLEGVASSLRQQGHDGLGVFAGRATSPKVLSRAQLREKNVILVNATYSGLESILDRNQTKSYQGLVSMAKEAYTVDSFSKAAISVPTSVWSKPPHYSKWPWKGSTPQLFAEWLSSVGRRLVHYQGSGVPLATGRPTLFLYNVAEWLEAGAGLQPNMADGFGYLQQVEAVAKELEAYASTGPFATPGTTNLVMNGSFESSPLEWSLYVDSANGADASTAINTSDPQHLTRSVRIEIVSGGSGTHHVQLYQSGRAITQGQLYRLSFYARADGPRSMVVKVFNHSPPWNAYGLDAEVILSTAWKRYELFFEATSDASDARLDFFLGADTKSVELDQAEWVEVS